MWSTCKGWTIFQHTLMQQNESNEKTMNNNEWSWRMCFLAEEANGKWRWTARASNSKLYNFQTENGGISTQLKGFYQETPKVSTSWNTRIPGPNTMISPSWVHPRYCQCITRSTAGDAPQFVTLKRCPRFLRMNFQIFFPQMKEDHLIVFL